MNHRISHRKKSCLPEVVTFLGLELPNLAGIKKQRVLSQIKQVQSEGLREYIQQLSRS